MFSPSPAPGAARAMQVGGHDVQLGTTNSAGAEDVVAQAEALAERSAVQRGRLLAFVLDCIPATDWADAKPLAQMTWTLALEQGDLDFAEPVTADESELVGPLASAARTVLRQYLHPAPFAAPAEPEQRPAPQRKLTPLEQHFVEQYAVIDVHIANAA